MTENQIMRKLLLRSVIHTLEACKAIKGGVLVSHAEYLRCLKGLGLFGPEIIGDPQELIYEFRRWMQAVDLDDYLPSIKEIEAAVNKS